MAKHRTHSTEFKRQVVQEDLAGETLHELANRHDLSRNLIRIWVEKYQAGGLDEDAVAADLLQSHEARIAALERLVGKQALELEFPKGASRAVPRPKAPPRPPSRPCGMSVAEGCRLMTIARSTVYAEPSPADDDTAIVEAMSRICFRIRKLRLAASVLRFDSRA